MNILLITPMLHQGGFERICILTAHLLQPEHKVTIAVFSLEDLAFDIEGLDVVNLEIPSTPGVVGKVLHVIKRAKALGKLQKERQIDVSYSFGITANIANSLTRHAGKKLVACHSFEEIKSSRYMKLIGKGSDKLLCCSKKMAALVQEKYGFSQVCPLWNPCDLERIKKQAEEHPEDFDFFEKEGRRRLVTMGREDDVKGYWHLMKIFGKVAEQFDDVDLAVVGDGTFEEYREMAAEMGLGERVIFTGNKRNPFPYLKVGEIFLLTSLSEGLPNALVEAMTIGLPIVSVNCQTGPAEILHSDFEEAEAAKGVFYGDYGILTPPLRQEKNTQIIKTDGKLVLDEAQEAMAREVITLLSSPGRLEEYRRKGPVRATDFSTQAYASRLKELF